MTTNNIKNLVEFDIDEILDTQKIILFKEAHRYYSKEDSTPFPNQILALVNNVYILPLTSYMENNSGKNEHLELVLKSGEKVYDELYSDIKQLRLDKQYSSLL